MNSHEMITLGAIEMLRTKIRERWDSENDLIYRSDIEELLDEMSKEVSNNPQEDKSAHSRETIEMLRELLGII